MSHPQILCFKASTTCVRDTRLPGRIAASTVAVKPITDALNNVKGMICIRAVYPKLAFGGGGIGMPTEEIISAEPQRPALPRAGLQSARI